MDNMSKTQGNAQIRTSNRSTNDQGRYTKVYNASVQEKQGKSEDKHNKQGQREGLLEIEMWGRRIQILPQETSEHAATRERRTPREKADERAAAARGVNSRRHR
jgi:hypothetical protein